MRLAWSETDDRAFDAAVAQARAIDTSGLISRDRECRFDRTGWQQLAAGGATALLAEGRSTPEGALSVARHLEALGLGCADHGLLLSLNAHLWGCVGPLARSGRPALRDAWLGRLCAGAAIGALAATEAQAGSDLATLATRAERHAGGWRLSGAKQYVTNAVTADLVLVLATTADRPGPFSTSLFAVPRDTPGLTSAPVATMGFRTAGLGSLTLDGCNVPDDALVGSVGSGVALFAEAMRAERSFILGFAVGSMQRRLDACILRARERQQFGRAIGAFQQVSGRLVDMKLRLEDARAALYRAAWAWAASSEGGSAAAAKYRIGEAWVRSCEDAVQLHGALGYEVESGLERDLRDAIGARLFSGTSEMQRETIARAMLIR